MIISVIIPVYNHRNYLKDSIESVLNQTFKDFELFIINDGSTDDSAVIIKEYEKVDSRIVFINLKTNIGAATARNIAIRKSSGKYTAIFDADDVCLGNRLQKQYEFLEEYQEFYLVGGGAIRIDQYGNKVSIFNPITDYAKVHERLIYENCIYHSSVMFRNTREVFYRRKFEHAEDYDFYLNLLSAGKLLTNISDKIIKYRLQPNYQNSLKLKKQLRLARKAQEFYHQRILFGKDEYKTLDLKKLFKVLG